MTTKSPAESTEDDSAAATPTAAAADSCTTTEEAKSPHEIDKADIDIQSAETPTKKSPDTAKDNSQHTEDATAVAAVETVAVVPKEPAWGLPSISADAPSTTTFADGNNKKGESAPVPTLSFAEIMNDQSRDRAAARVAYTTNNIVDETVSLTGIQAEQERLFASLASKGKGQEPLLSGNSHDNNVNIIDPMLSGIDEEERKMIELAMQQSLAECNNNNNNVNNSSNKIDTETAGAIKDIALAAAGLVATTTNNETSEEKAEREMIEAAIREADAMEQQLNADTTTSIEVDGKPGAKASESIPQDDAKPVAKATHSNPADDSKFAAKPASMATKSNTEDDAKPAAVATKSSPEEDSKHAAKPAAIATKPSPEDIEKEMIEAAIREADAREQLQNADTAAIDAKPAAKATKSNPEDIEKEMIEAAIREADAKERADTEAESLKLVMQLQQEEIANARYRQQHQRQTAMSTGNIRTMTRAELAAETYGDKNPVYDYDDGECEENASETGFRMNQQNQHQPAGWYRRDRNTIVGPDNEIRTKHDVKLQGQTNASFLDLDIVDDDTGLRTHVGNKAFNAFRKTVAGNYHAKGGHRGTSKGVATHGTGRAGSDADATKGGAMDQQVRLHISKAINTGIIERCNGVVKQGKEAVVYHAVGGISSNKITPQESNGSGDESTANGHTKGNESTGKGDTTISDNGGFDVAIKVFKRIKEFKGRGEYVDGDPRYAGRPFRSFTERAQLEIWTEKEYRNLVRAYRAEVPVPNPIHYKENVIFMRFLGQEGWPAPQIREINIRKGSSKWTALYEQVMGSVQRLFQDARLVHGDLSEYNILIAPNVQVDHKSKNIESDEDLQTVLIDFGQAVEVRHPKAEELLKRDLSRVREFFSKQGVATAMSLEDALEFVIGDHSFSVNMNDTRMSEYDE